MHGTTTGSPAAAFSSSHAASNEMSDSVVQGVYSARFLINNSLVGAGIVVIAGASLHGGDLHYRYKGKYELCESRMSTTVDVENYAADSDSVLDPLRLFRLTLHGVAAPLGFSLVGAVDGQPHLGMRIDLKKMSELVDR